MEKFLEGKGWYNAAFLQDEYPGERVITCLHKKPRDGFGSVINQDLFVAYEVNLYAVLYNIFIFLINLKYLQNLPISDVFQLEG